MSCSVDVMPETKLLPCLGLLHDHLRSLESKPAGELQNGVRGCRDSCCHLILYVSTVLCQCLLGLKPASGLVVLLFLGRYTSPNKAYLTYFFLAAEERSNIPNNYLEKKNNGIM